MISMIVLATAVFGFFLAWHLRGGAAASFVAVLAACSLPTIELFSVGDSSAVTAIAAPNISFSTFHLALAAAFLTLPRQAIKNISGWFWLFLLFLAVFVVAQAIVAPHTLSGVLQWVWVVLAWGLAGAIAQSRIQQGQPTERWMAISIAGVIAWHLVTAVLQLAGIRGVSSIGVGALEVARVSGAAGHSGNLGKVMFLLIILLLPLTRSTDRIAKNWAICAVIVASGLTGLTYSRANTLAVVVLLAVWLLFGPGLRLANRILIPIAGLIIALPVIDVLVLRNEYDPEGGSRPLLLVSALKQISETFWFGVGPNNYLEVVGRFDPLAAGGLPVHSAFLLALAELGAICAVLLLIPLIVLAVRSVANFRKGAESGRYATAAVAAGPGVLLIAGTGWGILHEQYLILLFFVLGYLSAAQGASVWQRQGAVGNNRLRKLGEGHEHRYVERTSTRTRTGETAGRDDSLHRSGRHLRGR